MTRKRIMYDISDHAQSSILLFLVVQETICGNSTNQEWNIVL